MTNALTYEDVRDYCVTLCRVRGNSAAHNLLRHMGYPKLPDIPVNLYQEFIVEAGRMIDSDDYFPDDLKVRWPTPIPRGVPEETKEKTPFRIGGVYRQQCGRVVRLVDDMWETHREKWEAVYPGHKFVSAVDVAVGSAHGYVSMANGKYVHGFSYPAGENLLPGELIQRDGQWVAVEEKPADMLDALVAGLWPEVVGGEVADPNAAMIARDDQAQDEINAWHEQMEAGMAAACGLKSTAKPALPCLTSSPDLTGEWKPFEFGSAHLKG